MVNRLDHQVPCLTRSFGKERSHNLDLNSEFSGILDQTISYGWHSCGDKYIVTRNEESIFSRTYLIIITLKGHGIGKVNGGEFDLLPNTVMIFPEGKFHSYYVPDKEEWEFYWIHTAGTGCSALLKYIIDTYGLINTVNCTEQLCDLLESLLVCNYSHPIFDFNVHSTINRMLSTLLTDLSAFQQNSDRKKSLVDHVITYIETHYMEDVSLKLISSLEYISEGQIIRIFKSETGMTPHQYIMRYRLKMAAFLLKGSNQSVAEVSRTVGYHSVSTFIVQFKSVYRVTPKEYQIQRNNEMTQQGE